MGEALSPIADRLSPGCASHPFDALAAEYDERFTDTALGRLLRRRVWRVLDRRFAAGDVVLDLGCGTGEDAVHLAVRGVRVVAADASQAMLALARRKAEATGVLDAIAFLSLDLARLPAALPTLRSALAALSPTTRPGDRPRAHGPRPTSFSAAYSDFGALNALADLRPLAAALAALLPAGAPLFLVVMPPVCPWEILWHFAHGELDVARRRLRSGTRARLAPGAELAVHYPTVGRLRRALAPHFRLRRVESLGLLLPPSHLAGVAGKHPLMTVVADRLERALAALPPFSRLGDHVLLELERCAA